METQEDKNVYSKYSQTTIDKWTNWLDNIPKGAPPEMSAKWYKSIGDFSRNPNVIFQNRKTKKVYISPDHFETFLNKYFPDATSYYHLKFADIKREMDMEPAASFLGEGGSKRKRKSKSKSKSKSKRKSKSKSKRKSNKKSKRRY
jgi:hypothetical protein